MHIIPNWHPFFVHFAVSLIVMTGIMQLVLLAKKSSSSSWLEPCFKFLTVTTSIILLATIASGIFAYFSVNHDSPSHVAMNDHRNWAIATSVIFIIGTLVYCYLPTLKTKLASSCFIAATALVLVTGFKGSELVFKYGLGVQSMPEVTGEGHDHDHDHDHAEQTAANLETTSNLDTHLMNSEPAAVVTGFLEALVAGDAELAKSMLADDVLIFEGGGVERSAEEYASHHMHSDMKFLSALNRESLEHQVREYGDVAVSRARTRLTGKFNDKDYDIQTMETIVLQNQEGVWKIIDIHWSN